MAVVDLKSITKDGEQWSVVYYNSDFSPQTKTITGGAHFVNSCCKMLLEYYINKALPKVFPPITEDVRVLSLETKLKILEHFNVSDILALVD